MKAIVLCSGGLKSALLTSIAKKEGEVVLLYFDHKTSVSNYEWEAVQQLGEYYQIGQEQTLRHYLPSIDPLCSTMQHFLWLMLNAVPVARKTSCNILYHGLSYNETSKVRIDDIENFINGLQQLISNSAPTIDCNIWRGVLEVETPLRRLTLSKILRYGENWLVPWNITRSCIKQKYACSTCAGCRRRHEAFVTAGMTEPNPEAVYRNNKGKNIENEHCIDITV